MLKLLTRIWCRLSNRLQLMFFQNFFMMACPVFSSCRHSEERESTEQGSNPFIASAQQTITIAYAKLFNSGLLRRSRKASVPQSDEKTGHGVFMVMFGLLMMSLLSSCSNTIERLSRVGKAPDFAKIELPAMDIEPQDAMKKHTQTEVTQKYAQRVNSLWSPGSNNFFRNKHNWRVGDIVVVKVDITDSAKLDNSTQHTRQGSEAAGIPNLLGLENTIAQAVSSTGDPKNLVNTTNNHQHQGSGNISRQEDVRTEISAIITQVFPNGNLLVQGRQEIRINNELREVTVAGIIRPKDISDANSIKSEQMAEARISYGGRGTVSDVQEPRIGNQVLDILSPF